MTATPTDRRTAAAPENEHPVRPDADRPADLPLDRARRRHPELLDAAQHFEPAASGRDDGDPRTRTDLCHHHRRHRSFGWRHRRLLHRHHRLAAAGRRAALGGDRADARHRRGDRRLPWLRHRPYGPAAVHHHAGNPDIAARHRPADHQRFDDQHHQ